MGDSSVVRLAIGAVVLVSAVGCGDRAGQSSGPDDVVPFERRPAELPTTPHDEVATPDVPECTPDLVTFDVVTDAEVLGSDPGPVGTAAPENRNIALMARPGQRCALSAWPALRLTASGAPPEEVEPENVGPPPERLLLAGRQRAVGIVRWRSSCAPPDAEVGVEATLAGGDTVWAALPDRPGCDPGARNTGGFFVTFPTRPPDSPLAAELVDLPATAPFDGTLQLTVELSNPGAEPVSLDPCPVYRLAYGESGTVVEITNELNCPAAPERIPAGGRLPFAAELELPREEVPRGFVGTVMVDIHLDEDHGSAAARAELRTE